MKASNVSTLGDSFSTEDLLNDIRNRLGKSSSNKGSSKPASFSKPAQRPIIAQSQSTFQADNEEEAVLHLSTNARATSQERADASEKEKINSNLYNLYNQFNQKDKTMDNASHNQMNSDGMDLENIIQFPGTTPTTKELLSKIQNLQTESPFNGTGKALNPNSNFKDELEDEFEFEDEDEDENDFESNINDEFEDDIEDDIETEDYETEDYLDEGQESYAEPTAQYDYGNNTQSQPPSLTEMEAGSDDYYQANKESTQYVLESLIYEALSPFVKDWLEHNLEDVAREVIKNEIVKALPSTIKTLKGK